MNLFLISLIIVLIDFGIVAETVNPNESFKDHSLEIKEFDRNNAEKLLIFLKKVNIPGYPNALNPSLLEDGDGYLLVFRHSPGPTTKESYIGVVKLDQYFDPISVPDILTTRQTGSEIISRLQDARIFSLNGKNYVAYNDNLDLVYPNPNGRKDMYMSELVYEEGHFQLLPPLKLVYNAKYYTQMQHKNWVPFVWKDQLLFAYYINPHEILLPNLTNGDCSLLSETSFETDWKWGQLRGGTPAVLVDGEYLAFFHSCILVNKVKHYFMGAYTFSSEPPFKITKVSPKPIMDHRFYTEPRKKKRSIFPGGLVVSGDYIYIAYGKDNKEVWIARMKKKNLMKTLLPLGNK